jgi:ribosomal protein S18 acetylase RimI-like enzyme
VITRATPTDRDRVIQTVVAAFEADPAFRFFFPDDDTYVAYAAAFAGHLFDRRVSSDSVWLAEAGASVAMWEPPHRAAREAGSTLELPADVIARLDVFDAAAHALLPATPHWYLGVLATHPDSAGRRLGRALLAAGVAQARADRLPACLETTNPNNVELYRRAGWQVVGSTAASGVPIWVMMSAYESTLDG